MAVFTITTNSRSNQPPSVIGTVNVNVDHAGVYVFTVSDFTSNTLPPYEDPEGDDIKSIKILDIPTIGEFFIGGIPVLINDEIAASDIAIGLFTYKADAATFNSYTDSNAEYDASDVGSSAFAGLTARIIIKVSAFVNQPPTSVGDGDESIEYGQTLVFTRAMFTSLLAPPYNDPEGDAALNLKITGLSTNGELKVNGVVVGVNQVISFADIDAGLFTYNGDLSITNGIVEGFQFQVADTGSGIFVG